MVAGHGVDWMELGFDERESPSARETTYVEARIRISESNRMRVPETSSSPKATLYKDCVRPVQGK